MAFKLDGKTLPLDVAFTSRGINYPANWLRLSSADEKKAAGITEEADTSINYDQRFYTSPSTAKRLADEDAKDKDGNLIKDADGNQVVNEGLKTLWIRKQKLEAGRRLAKSDWYVIRKSEKTTAIPTNIQTYRDAVRTACTTRETEINAAADVAALKTLIDGTITQWPEEAD